MNHEKQQDNAKQEVKIHDHLEHIKQKQQRIKERIAQMLEHDIIQFEETYILTKSLFKKDS